MAIWDRLRGRQRSPGRAPADPARERQEQLSGEIFTRILEAAQALHAMPGQDRSVWPFEGRLGSYLADQCIDAQDGPEAMRTMTAALLSHCDYDEALMFVLKLTDAGRHFGVSIGPDIAIACDRFSERSYAAIDVYSVAAHHAKRAQLPQQSGPFTGPGRVLWDAGYSGVPRTRLSVKSAAEDLERRVTQTWDIPPPPRPYFFSPPDRRGHLEPGVELSFRPCAMPGAARQMAVYTEGMLLVCIAGIWREQAEIGEAFSLLMMDAGLDIVRYHHRQIIPLPRDRWVDWLDPSAPAAQASLELS